MSSRRLCILLAGLLMLAGGLVGIAVKEADTPAAIQEVNNAVSDESMFAQPVCGEIVSAFGAVYEERLNQWSLREYTEILTETGSLILSPIDGTVEDIIRGENGGSIYIEGNEFAVMIAPVSDVRVFKGSAVARGSIIGKTGARVTVSVDRDNVPVDPKLLIGENSVHDEQGA